MELLLETFVCFQELWQLNSDPMQEQQVLLTAEPSLPPYGPQRCLIEEGRFTLNMAGAILRGRGWD